jgi:two-component system torCAD operon response regulator TorR
LTRNEILDLVASREWTSTDRSIDVLVGKLRKKVEADPRNPIYIHTQRGVGYKFSPLSS